MKRSEMNAVTRQTMSRLGFLELETPFLVKYTPGGARNFLVPARLQAGKFYALAESPQLFKQLFMVSGFDRYFQIVKCFRDEDLRLDRQPEFTQIDLEMSFVSQDDVFAVVEELVIALWREILGIEIQKPFQRMSYEQSMREYGNESQVHTVLANLRLYLGKKLGLIPEHGPRDAKDPASWNFLWVVNPPLFEYDEEHKKYVAAHHAFTRPRDEDVQYLETDPGRVLCHRNDLVLNGFEIGGGSIRLHDPAVQQKVFAAMGIGRDEAEQKFGFLLQAVRFGAPPHGGIALGMDRMSMPLSGSESLRDDI